jgi:hypothetical protein
LVAGFYRYAVFNCKSIKIVPVYPVLTSGEPESGQIAFFNPSQDGYLAYPAVPGHNTGGEIQGISLFQGFSQFVPPSNQKCRTIDDRMAGIIDWLRLHTLFTRLTLFTKVLELL